jgi:DNA-binding MarR family transcriptional regulator
VTNLIDRLEKNGLVQRKRLGTDKRTINVVLTDLGEAKYNEAPELLQSGFLREYRKLEPWEQHMLVSAVGRVASMMDAEDIDASPILAIGDIDEGELYN